MQYYSFSITSEDLKNNIFVSPLLKFLLCRKTNINTVHINQAVVRRHIKTQLNTSIQLVLKTFFF